METHNGPVKLCEKIPVIFSGSPASFFPFPFSLIVAEKDQEAILSRRLCCVVLLCVSMLFYMLFFNSKENKIVGHSPKTSSKIRNILDASFKVRSAPPEVKTETKERLGLLEHPQSENF